MFVHLFDSDIDECDLAQGLQSRCGEGAICSNTPGSFSCQCPPGFSGDPSTRCLGKQLNIAGIFFRYTYYKAEIMFEFLFDCPYYKSLLFFFPPFITHPWGILLTSHESKREKKQLKKMPHG